MGLVQLLVMFSILSILMFGVIRMFQTSQRSIAHISGKNSVGMLAYSLRLITENSQACNGAFRKADGTNVTYTAATSPVSVSQIFMGTTRVVGVGDTLDSGVKLDSLSLVSTGVPSSTISIEGTTYNLHFVSLNVQATRLQNIGGNPVVTQKFFLGIATNTTTHAVEKCIQSGGDSEGSETLIARHSFTSTAPSCPSGWNLIWTGYSFAGALSGGGGAYDLGDPGSCLETFKPLPFNECGSWNQVENCFFATPGDYSYWLTTAGPTDEAGVSGIVNILPKISRCSVCSKKVSVIARHSFTASVPSCPSGWNSMWVGYSFGGFAGDSLLNTKRLGGSGSCLEVFKPIPIIECWNGDMCDYGTGGDLTMWLTTVASSGGQGPWTGAAAEAKTSRCRVCEK